MSWLWLGVATRFPRQPRRFRTGRRGRWHPRRTAAACASFRAAACAWRTAAAATMLLLLLLPADARALLLLLLLPTHLDKERPQDEDVDHGVGELVVEKVAHLGARVAPLLASEPARAQARRERCAEEHKRVRPPRGGGAVAHAGGGATEPRKMRARETAASRKAARGAQAAGPPALIWSAKPLCARRAVLCAAHLLANLAAESPAAGLESPDVALELRFISALTFSSCGSCSWLRGVQISSSRPVHCGRGTRR